MKNKRFFSLVGKTKSSTHGSIESTVGGGLIGSEANDCNTMELSPLFGSLTKWDTGNQALYRNYLEAFNDAQLLLEQGNYAQARIQAQRAKECLLDIDVMVVLMADLSKIAGLENLIDTSSMKNKC